MHRLARSPLPLLLVALALAAGVPHQAPGARTAQAGERPEHTRIPLELFHLPDGLEVTLWAESPLLHNPTNIDIDKDGRIWVAEGVRYRHHHARRPDGDRIVVLQDTTGDGKADSAHTFVQEPGLVAPLGIAVIDNKVVVSQPPDLIVYTDVDRNLRFDPAVDTREVLLTGFQGINHDHSLHSVTVGPDGKWVFNAGNCGAKFTDRSGKTFRIFGPYRPGVIGPFEDPHDPAEHAGRPSDDGHVYVGGFTARMNPDGTGVEIIGHNYRNSYEQSVTSLGDVFQNDNDDPPACRVSWVMEYANFGFASNDGQRSWQADRRPGQTIPVAHWRQDDPGIAPAGDVYGGGSPTGNVFYENGGLGAAWEGTFFAAEPGRNEIFAYQPEPEGAGFRLERTVFLTSNVEEKWAGSDFLGGSASVTGDIATLFRPSDIAVGPDGALYVSDWIDARVGGHEALDDTLSGAIYRIAPKGFVSKVPAFDSTTIEGLIAALRSPAVNVRAIGFEGLKARGAAAVEAVAALLDDPNVYMRGRAIFLLYQLGPEGRQRAGSPERYADPRLRIAAYRAMRRADLGVMEVARRLARDADAGVRREVALSMRNEPAGRSLDVLADIARGFDGKDRSYLEALGTGATGKERALYERLRHELGCGSVPDPGSLAGGDPDAPRRCLAGAPGAAPFMRQREQTSHKTPHDGLSVTDPLAWPEALAWIAWRLQVPAAVPDLSARARSPQLSLAERRLAMDALAFVKDPAASEAMLSLAEMEGPLREPATWWLLNRLSNDWADHGLLPALKARGIYDPDSIALQETVVRWPSEDLPEISIDEVLTLTGDPARGRDTAMRCVMCHAIDGAGPEVGPALDGWARGKSDRVIATAIVHPDAEIAHGFGGTEIRTTDGLLIQGLLIKEGDPLMMRSTGGLTQIIPADRVASRERMARSLMPSAAQLGLTAQDVADLVAFMRSR
jgi:putative membrane-bound dehydrogenase-like protein